MVCAVVPSSSAFISSSLFINSVVWGWNMQCSRMVCPCTYDADWRGGVQTSSPISFHISRWSYHWYLWSMVFPSKLNTFNIQCCNEKLHLMKFKVLTAPLPFPSYEIRSSTTVHTNQPTLYQLFQLHTTVTLHQPASQIQLNLTPSSVKGQWPFVNSIHDWFNTGADIYFLC